MKICMNTKPYDSFSLQDGRSIRIFPKPPSCIHNHLMSALEYTSSVFQRRKPPTFSVRLDFLKCVQIFLSSKTQICTVCLYRFALLAINSRHISVQICVMEERKMSTLWRKSRRTEIAEGFHLCYIIRKINLHP